jgi:hypothetical protein
VQDKLGAVQVTIKPLYMAKFADSSYIVRPRDELFSGQPSKRLSVEGLLEVSSLLTAALTSDCVGIDELINVLLYAIV